MLLNDVETLLGITIADAQKAMYEARLSAAIDHAKQYCNRSFEDKSGVLDIPKGAQMGIALIVKAMGETQNVASQSLGDMAKSFFQGGTQAAAEQYLKPYRRAGFK